MSPIRIDYTLSVGNIATILLLVLGGGMAWGTLQTQVATTRELIDVTERRLDYMERVAAEREVRLRALETGAAGDEEKFVRILDGLLEINERLEEINGSRP